MTLISAPAAWFLSSFPSNSSRRYPQSHSVLLRSRCLHLSSINPDTLIRPSGASIAELIVHPRSVTLRKSFAPYNSRSVSCSAVGVVGFDGSTIAQDAGATLFVIAGAYALVSSFDILSRDNIIQQSLSRKLVHILSGLLFMASWPLFSTSSEARFFAVIGPVANALRLLVYGLSLANDEGLIKSITREGKPEELLKGPFFYVLVLILCTLVFWRESPVGIISLTMMCGGDGIADIIGRRFGSAKLPYNQNKSWAGSISMFSFGFLVAVGMLYYFSALGYFRLDWLVTAEKVALVSLVATAIETLPAELIDDNISVPLASMAVAYMCFSSFNT